MKYSGRHSVSILTKLTPRVVRCPLGRLVFWISTIKRSPISTPWVLGRRLLNLTTLHSTGGLVKSHIHFFTKSTVREGYGHGLIAAGPVFLSSTPTIISPPTVFAKHTVASLISCDRSFSFLHHPLNSSDWDSRSWAGQSFSCSKILERLANSI